MTKDTLVTILIPSWNNFEYLRGAVESLLTYQSTPGLMRIIVVNNGHENSCDFIQNENVTVINAGKNLGWEGGITEGLKHTTSEFVCFFNDDAYIPAASRGWLNKLLQHFKDPKVAAVGPTSNVVMGNQNIWTNVGNLAVLPATYLIGFCVLMRRSAFDEIGGMDLDLPSGDDLDWSIRLRDAGYKLLVDKEVFVYHHGFKTGTRIMGDHQTAGGWNSFEQWNQTNTALIKKHGVKKWWECVKGPDISGFLRELNQGLHDSEGELIRGLLTEEDKHILDIGCGNNKTLERAVGIDMIAPGQKITSLSNVAVSRADIVADISKDIPVEDGSQDVIISRHILEHMVDPVKAISLWGSKLKVGGRLIVAVPNEEWLNSIPMNSEHVHAFTPESMVNLMTILNFEVKSINDGGNYISFVTEVVKKG